MQPSSSGRTIDVALVRRSMEAAWTETGYTSPSPETYPWLWSWDSCFHAMVWGLLDPGRAISELGSVFAAQSESGFVPHMFYGADPDAARQLWSKRGSSTITQPPMFGHAIRFLVERGIEVPDRLKEAAWMALRHLVNTRMRSNGLLVVVHSWETGCDDSARFGSWQPDPFVKSAWDETKHRWLSELRVVDGGAVANPLFEVESAMFNALVVFNTRELARVSALEPELMTAIEGIERGLDQRWDPATATWADGFHSSATAPTIESLLPLLLGPPADRSDPAWAAIEDRERFMAPWGPRQTARSHPAYDPDAYWRGPTWPQLNYLLWVAANRAGRTALAGRLRALTIRGAMDSGMSEYWNPETGQGRGARPQTWTFLAWLMQEVGP